MAVTPDDRYVLVANWCSCNLSVIERRPQAEWWPRLPMGAYPRGIAVSPDASSAYVAIMGGDTVVKVNLATPAKRARSWWARTPGTSSWTRPGAISTPP